MGRPPTAILISSAHPPNFPGRAPPVLHSLVYCLIEVGTELQPRYLLSSLSLSPSLFPSPLWQAAVCWLPLDSSFCPPLFPLSLKCCHACAAVVPHGCKTNWPHFRGLLPPATAVRGRHRRPTVLSLSPHSVFSPLFFHDAPLN